MTFTHQKTSELNASRIHCRHYLIRNSERDSSEADACDVSQGYLTRIEFVPGIDDGVELPAGKVVSTRMGGKIRKYRISQGLEEIRLALLQEKKKSFKIKSIEAIYA